MRSKAAPFQAVYGFPIPPVCQPDPTRVVHGIRLTHSASLLTNTAVWKRPQKIGNLANASAISANPAAIQRSIPRDQRDFGKRFFRYVEMDPIN